MMNDNKRPEPTIELDLRSDGDERSIDARDAKIRSLNAALTEIISELKSWSPERAA